MYPRLFTLTTPWGPLTLHTYGVLLAAAFLAGLWVVTWQARRARLDGNRITDMAVYVLIAGLLGAKLLLLVVEWERYSNDLRALFSLVQSGGVFYGGLLGAIPVAWWYARRHALPAWATADVLAPGVILGQAVGRLGCLAASCCWGEKVAEGSPALRWAVRFTDPYAHEQTGVPLHTEAIPNPLHPTQVYESLACLLIFAVLVWMAPRKRFHGQIAMAYVGLYATARFFIESYRGDLARGTVLDGMLSTSQFIALATALLVVLLVPYVYKKNRVTPVAA